jgi:hypothetical protein
MKLKMKLMIANQRLENCRVDKNLFKIINLNLLINE